MVFNIDDIYTDRQGNKYKCTTAGTTPSGVPFDPNNIVSNEIMWGTVGFEKQESGGGGTNISDWATSTSYSVGDYVRNNNILYVCNTAHTSSTFSTDIANWTAITTEEMTGATSSTNGKAGIVPQPTTSDIDKFLCGDGTWKSAGNGLNIGRTLLWTGDIITTILESSPETLLDDYTNYDYLEFVPGYIQPGDTVSDGCSFFGSCFIKVEKVTDYYPSATFEYLSTNNNTGHQHFNMDIIFIGNNQFYGDVVRYRQTNTTKNCFLCLHKIYGIKLYNPNNYSTTEQEIGTWIDGKKLYQKTITGTTGSGNAGASIDCTALGIDNCVDISGYIKNTNGGFAPVNYNNNTVYTATNLGADKTMYLVVNGSIFSNCPYNITIKYTKV